VTCELKTHFNKISSLINLTSPFCCVGSIFKNAEEKSTVIQIEMN